jgi:hypothetical protein
VVGGGRALSSREGLRPAVAGPQGACGFADARRGDGGGAGEIDGGKVCGIALGQTLTDGANDVCPAAGTGATTPPAAGGTAGGGNGAVGGDGAGTPTGGGAAGVTA